MTREELDAALSKFGLTRDSAMQLVLRAKAIRDGQPLSPPPPRVMRGRVVKKPTTPPKPNGRPGKLTPEIALDIADRISKGDSQAEAARVNRLHPCTVKSWLRRGRSDIAAGRTGTDYAALVGLVCDAFAQWDRELYGPEGRTEVRSERTSTSPVESRCVPITGGNNP